MSQSRARKLRRMAERDQRAHPRCALCRNEIAPRDRDRMEDGKKVHRLCKERIVEAEKEMERQRVMERAQVGGLWIPGRDG